MTFVYKALALATLSGIAMAAHGAGLDRSGQDVTAFLQEGTYGEVVYTYIDASVSGTDTSGRPTGDIAEAYDFARFGVKADINDTFSVGVIYDEPFGAAIQHFGSSNFISEGADTAINTLTGGQVSNLAVAQAGLAQAQAGIAQLQSAIAQTAQAGQDTTALQAQLTQTVATATRLGGAINVAQTAESQQGQGTNVEIRTQNVALLFGAKLGDKKNFQIYGGPALQRLTGEVHLRGTAYSLATGYDAKISTDHTLGYVVGMAYLKPEIALRASLTYRSDTKHDSNVIEVFPTLGTNGITTQDFSVTLPESYNLDFQTGVSPTMLLTAKLRYVPWASFSIDPTLYTATTNTSIVSYDKDQWSGEVGLSKKINDKWVVSGNIGYDSGAGNPVSTLGPIKGYRSVGLGARYNFTPEWSVSAGLKYLKFGDVTAQLPTRTVAGQFDDNDGYIAGIKLAYHKK